MGDMYVSQLSRLSSVRREKSTIQGWEVMAGMAHAICGCMCGW